MYVCMYVCVCVCVYVYVYISLYKMFYCNALLWESIILLLRSLTCKAYPIAILMHDDCAIYAPHRPPPFMPYTIQYW